AAESRRAGDRQRAVRSGGGQAVRACAVLHSARAPLHAAGLAAARDHRSAAGAPRRRRCALSQRAGAARIPAAERGAVVSAATELGSAAALRGKAEWIDE